MHVAHRFLQQRHAILVLPHDAVLAYFAGALQIAFALIQLLELCQQALDSAEVSVVPASHLSLSLLVQLELPSGIAVILCKLAVFLQQPLGLAVLKG